ncbi:MAG TPA: OmpA family protein [Blastocatellia bacterium]|nr:OmpA family protein [Blastocatellia bacterium]
MLNKFVRLFLITTLIGLIIGAAGCAKPKVALQVSRDKIQEGQDVKVTWTSKDAKEVTLNGEKVDKVGSKEFTPTATTTYTGVATRGKKEARDSKTVDVSARAPKPTISISAEPEGIIKGENTTLRWNSSNAQTVSIDALGSVPASGSRVVSPEQSTTYTATANGPGGTDEASARVTVSGLPNRTPSGSGTANAAIESMFRSHVHILYFDYDKAELLPRAKDVLRNSAQWLTEGPYRSIAFRIEGNCDPRGTEEYNLGLGERRAQAAKDFLASLGVDTSRMQTVSYGRERSAGSSEGSPDNPPSWSHDRNDTFVYLSGGTLGPNPEPVTMSLD